MGRAEDSSDGDLSRFFYPAMQAADIFELNIDIAIGGMDQRKAHMYMREVADNWGWKKATCIHTPIISGLKSSGSRMESFDHKMSKSDPGGAILLHDTGKKMRKKLQGAYLDPTDTNSPVHELVEQIILPESGVLKVRPDPQYGEASDYNDLDSIRTDLSDGSLHPLDYKFAVADSIYNSLATLNSQFEENPELLAAVDRITAA
jgi:tyrosyl-tRNA synthetase